MPSSTDNRWESGLEALSSQLDIARDDLVERLRSRFGDRMATEAVNALGGAWGEDSPLSLRDRSLLVVAALVALGGAEARLRPHVRWAVAHGVTPDELEAAAAFLAVYVGFPRATVAMELIREELAAPEGGE